MKRILIAGVGNIFHGDDAFGVEVARALSARPLPEQVTVEDYGIRAYDLAFALTDNYDAVVLVDAMPRGKPPGTVSLLKPYVSQLGNLEDVAVDAHTLNPLSVLKMAQSLGGVRAQLYVLGCEPALLECEGGELGLSETVRAAVPTAVAMIESLINSLLNKEQHTTAGGMPA
jgi:hydrogenase maturation protease